MDDIIVIAVVLKYDRSFSELPGIIIDLYHIYNSPVIQHADKVYIITDMFRDEDMDVINKAFFSGIVNGDVLDIINTIRDAGNLYPYIPDHGWLHSRLKACLAQRSKNILFYYSGHGQKDHIILPGGDKLMHDDLISLWIKYVNQSYQTGFLIFDCCQGVNFNLPYKYTDRGEWNLLKPESKYKSKLTVLNAAQLGEGAATEIQGSLFTGSLFHALNKDPSLHLYKTLFPFLQRECYKLAKEGQVQTCSIHTNYPNQERLPIWLLGIKSSVTEDNINDLIIINESSK